MEIIIEGKTFHRTKVIDKSDKPEKNRLKIRQTKIYIIKNGQTVKILRKFANETKKTLTARTDLI